MKTSKEINICIGLSPKEYEILEKAEDILYKLENKYQEVCESDRNAEVSTTRDTYQIIDRLRESADDICCDIKVNDDIINDDIYDPSEHTNS